MNRISACSSLLLKICSVWENMPKSDFPDLLQILINCSEFLEQLHWGKVRNISWHVFPASMDWFSLWKNKDVSVSHLYSLCFFKQCFSEAFLFYILVSSTQGHPSTNLAAAHQPLTRLLIGERTSWCHGQGGMSYSCKAKSWACGMKEKSVQWKFVISSDVV